MIHCVTLLFFHISSDLEHLLATQYFSGRLLPCQGSSDIFVPLLKILDQLLVMGVIQKDKDLRRCLSSWIQNCSLPAAPRVSRMLYVTHTGVG